MTDIENQPVVTHIFYGDQIVGSYYAKSIEGQIHYTAVIGSGLEGKTYPNLCDEKTALALLTNPEINPYVQLALATGNFFYPENPDQL